MVERLNAFGWSRRLARLTWLCTIATVAWLLFSWLLPQRLYILSAPYRIAAVISFFGRVFTFHAGIALAVATIMGLLLRRRRLSILAGVAAIAALLPTLCSFSPKSPSATVGPTVRVI